MCRHRGVAHKSTPIRFGVLWWMLVPIFGEKHAGGVWPYTPTIRDQRCINQGIGLIKREPLKLDAECAIDVGFGLDLGQQIGGNWLIDR